MADEMIKPSIRVLTYAGAGEDVQTLARGIQREATKDIAKLDPARVVGTLEFDEPVIGVDDLAGRLADGRDTILHLVSHASESGAIAIDDIWGNLRLTPETLARMVKGNGVKVVMVSACWGAEIAKSLVDARAASVAIGYTAPMSMPVAAQLARGFYRSLVQGNSPRTAAGHGITFAEARRADDEGKFAVWSRRSNYPDDPLFGPQFHIIGTPIASCEDAVDKLTEHLEPYAVSHISKADFGDGIADMEWSLRNARVILVLADDEPVDGTSSPDEGAFLTEVHAAIEQAQMSKVRVVPLFLDDEVTRAPYGLGRLVPAFLHSRQLGGSYAKLAEALKRALEKDLQRR